MRTPSPLIHDECCGRRWWWPAITGLAVAVVSCGPPSPDSSRTDFPAGEVTASAVAFTDVTGRSGLGSFRQQTGAVGNRWFPESMGSGGGFVDFDGDGWQDVILAGGGRWESTGPVPDVRLFRNLGDGTFTDVSKATGLTSTGSYTFGVTAADMDNDGDEDLYVTALRRNLFFENRDGTFIERGREAGVAGPDEWSTSAMFFEADGDGFVDLLVGNYVDWSPENDLTCLLEGQIRSYCTPELYNGTPPRFFHNNGDGTFADWTEQAGFGDAPGKTLGVAEYDLNGDGWSDVFISNDTQRDLLFLNNGDGTFTERGEVGGMAYDQNGRARAGMGIDIGVVDSTGEPTLFVGNFSREMIAVYRYAGHGIFLDRSATSRIGRPSLTTLTFGLFLLDADLDGDLDLFCANGHVQPEIEKTQTGITYAQGSHLFLNHGDGTFEDGAAADSAVAQPVVARGAAYADYDLDGDLDVLITQNDGPVRLLRNDLESGHAVRVRLEGVRSNRDGLTSRVELVVGGRRVTRFVRTGSSIHSVSEKPLTFGLGSEPSADSLVIYWTSGRVDRYGRVAAGTEVEVVEGEREPMIRSLPGLTRVP